MINRSDRGLRLILTRFALIGALAIPAVASAQGVSPIDASAAQKKQATDHFAVGKRALESNNWEKAISELHASLEVVDSPNARLELARALRESGNLGEAWAEFRRAADVATRLAPNEERYAKTAEAAFSEGEEIGGKLAFVEVTVTHAPADAALKVGGRIVASEDWRAPVPVAAGAVDVILSNGAGTELARLTVNAVLGQTTPVPLDVQPAHTDPDPSGKALADISEEDKPPADTRPVPLALPQDVSPSGPTKLRTFAYAAAGAGVAGLATFTVFGVLSNSTFNDLKSACPHGCPSDKRSEVDRGATEQTIANVGLAVGLFGLAAGTTLYFLSFPAKSPIPTAAIVVAPGYLGVRGSL